MTLRRAAVGCGPWSNYLTTTLPHELGHVLGFSHVSDPLAVMHAAATCPPFTAREQYHMLLAYEVGRGRSYCGWRRGAVAQGVHLIPRWSVTTLNV